VKQLSIVLADQWVKCFTQRFVSPPREAAGAGAAQQAGDRASAMKR
jgi:hypothetical protein